MEKNYDGSQPFQEWLDTNVNDQFAPVGCTINIESFYAVDKDAPQTADKLNVKFPLRKENEEL